MYHSAFPPAINRVLIAPNPLQHLALSVFWILWYHIFVLICNSLMTYYVEHFFICLLAFFGEVSVQVCCLFFNQLVHFLIVEFQGLCILHNSPLLYVTFANIFSHILLTMSFTEKKILILTKSSLSVISFMDCAFGLLI